MENPHYIFIYHGTSNIIGFTTYYDSGFEVTYTKDKTVAETSLILYPSQHW